jgi:pilus assembly protein CpaF
LFFFTHQGEDRPVAKGVRELAQSRAGRPRRSQHAEVVGLEQDIITLQELFIYRHIGVNSAGKGYGEFEATGVQSHYDPRFRAMGITLPADLFHQHILMQA